MHLSFSGWVSALMLLFSTLVARGQTDSVYTVNNDIACSEHCCFTDPSPVGMMYSHLHPQGQWMVSYRYMYMGMGDMYAGHEKFSNDKVLNEYIMSSNDMKMQMHMFMAMYGVSDRLTLMAMVNYNVNAMTMISVPGGHHHGTTTEPSSKVKSNGLGDTKIAAMFGLLEKSHHHLMLIGGLSIPTGSIQQEGESGQMYAGQRLPYSMQTGSGTWDLQPGANYYYESRNFTYGAQVLATVRTGYNSVGYKLGNDITFNNWIAWQWNQCFSSTARFEVYSAGQIKGEDPDLYAWNEPAANPANYGGERLSAYLGTSYGFRTGILKNHKIGAEFGIPVYQSLHGPQQGTKSTLVASWVKVF